MLRRALITGVVAVLTAGAVAAPAEAAVGPFHPPIAVVRPGCSFQSFAGDAVVGRDGVTRGFIGFTGGDCDPPGRIWYFSGSGTRWTSTLSPYHGRVLGVAWDGAATYLLYAGTGGVSITKRTRSGFTSGRRLSSASARGGDVVALGGKWWAVWAEQVPEGVLDAPTRIYQALTIGRGHAHNGLLRRQATFRWGADYLFFDDKPRLTLAPGSTASRGRALLAWEGTDGDASWVHFSTAAGARRSR
jgi:hypothetical protein